MTIYYPKAVASLRILWENFGNDFDSFLNKEYSFNITPKSVTVSINDYTKADTFRMEIDYRNFPFDPRAIRACGVTIFIEDILQHYDAVGRYQELQPQENPFNIADSTNVVFIGFADDDGIKFDDSQRTVTLEGRDFTGILIDTPYDNQKPFPLTTPVDNIFAFLLSQLPATRNIQINQLGVGGTDLPILAAFAPDFNPLGVGRSKERNETYWDVIQSLAKKAGLIVYIDRDNLVLTKPNALYDRQKLKQFVWGKNLRQLSFKRKLGRMKNFNVSVRSMNIEKKTVIEAELPRDATVAWSLKTGIPRKRVIVKELLPTPPGGTRDKPANIISFRLPDISTKEHLVQVGENIFEELSRQQIEGSLVTKDMCVPEGDPGQGGILPVREPVEFDVTQLRIGAPIDIRIDQDDQKALANIAAAALQDRTDIPEKTLAELQQYLINRCYPPAVAFAFAKTMGKMDTPFYTKAIEYTLDSTQGFKMQLEFVNFIELPKSLVS